jgi:hypothetical protein
MKPSTQLWKELVIEFAAFSLLVASVSLLWTNNLLLFVVALAECLAGLALWHDPLDLSFLMIIAVLGSLAEVMFVHLGVWHYVNPTFLGVPLWFPLAFGTTGLIGGRLARTITKIWEEASSSGTTEAP